MQQQLRTLLQAANLRPEEVKIYLLLLKFQKTTIAKLTEKSSMASIMVYRTLKRLHKRGLVEEGNLNNKTNYYKPLSLDALITQIETERRKLTYLKMSLKNLEFLLPFMDGDNPSGEVQEQIIIKEGVDAFKREYLKFPNICKDEYLHIGSMDNLWETAGLTAECGEERNFIRKRMRKGIYARVLNPYSEVMDDIKKRDTLEKRTTRIKSKLPIMNNYLAIAESESTLFICDKKIHRQ